MQFLFSAALWALPLAGLPLILHLLFRQRAPTIPFSTLRFIQSSLQQNATRRKVQRWLLLACRALLVALLIWALAQPARKAEAGLSGGGASMAAAIVVDTSYSMMLQDQQRTLLQKADDAIQDLLRSELRDAHVAIFRSSIPSGANTPRLQLAEAYRGDRWAPLVPTASPVALVDRVAAAADMLNSDGDESKWLIVLTDSQQKEFPRPLPSVAGCRTIFIDLHPGDVRTAAITKVQTDPVSPRLGIPASITVETTGRANDARQVELHVSPLTENGPGAAASLPLPMARFDASGRAELRSPFSFADPSWLLVTAELGSSEALAWAQSRSELVRIPPRQSAAVVAVGEPTPLTVKMIRLALDPSEGERAAWPIALREGEPNWDEGLVVAVLNKWPDEALVSRMDGFVRGGHSLVIFVQPGLEQSWGQLTAARQAALAELLPSAPGAAVETAYHASLPRPEDAIFAGLGNVTASLGRLVVTRLVRFAPANSQARVLINAEPNDLDSGGQLTGLLWRKTVGAGTVYTWATMPDRSCGNLRVWDVFPPTLVNAGVPREERQVTESPNVELGQALSIDANLAPAGAEVDLIPPPPDQRPLKIDRTGDQYIYGDTALPGLYQWRWSGSDGKGGLLGWENVQIPAAEARLVYRPISEIATDPVNQIAGHSLEEVRQRLVELDEPTPQWTLPIAIVLLLLCLEGLLGAFPRHLARKRTGAGAATGAGAPGTVYVVGAESR